MFTKTITPIIRNKEVVGSQISYRFLGFLIYKKTLHTFNYFGVEEGDMRTDF